MTNVTRRPPRRGGVPQAARLPGGARAGASVAYRPSGGGIATRPRCRFFADLVYSDISPPPRLPGDAQSNEEMVKRASSTWFGLAAEALGNKARAQSACRIRGITSVRCSRLSQDENKYSRTSAPAIVRFANSESSSTRWLGSAQSLGTLPRPQRERNAEMGLALGDLAPRAGATRAISSASGRQTTDDLSSSRRSPGWGGGQPGDRVVP